MIFESLPQLHQALCNNGFFLTLEEFQKVIGPAFYASLERDEGRFSQFKIQILNEEIITNIEISPVTDFSYFQFKSQYTHKTIKRLCQALDYSRSGIVIRFSQGAPEISGFFTIGSNFEGFLNFKSFGAMVPSKVWTISFNKPGCFSIFCGVGHIVSFQSGQLVTKHYYAHETFQNTQFPAVFERFLKGSCGHMAFQNVLKENWLITFSKAISALLIGVMKLGHGGSILIFDDWQTIKGNLKFGVKFDPISSSQLLGAYLSGAISSNSIEKFPDLFALISKMSSCDGAVILNLGFDIIGFNCEITFPESSTVQLEKQALMDNFNFSDHGTRHRSVYRIIKNAKNSIGLVISQDGGNTVFLNDNGNFSLIKNLEKERADFLF